MDCGKCERKAVIQLQHGALCKMHFINYFEEKVFSTFKKYRLLKRDDKICVATSGGKDSLTVLYLTKRYLVKENLDPQQLFALVVDEGIENYRERTIEDLEKFCKEHDVELHKVSFLEELGATLDKAYPKINKDANKKPCNVCGVWRRYLLNREARKQGATKLVTGHNLDDEAQAIMMNIFKANTKIAGRLGPITGTREHGSFVQRVKPLYFCTEKEVRLYTILKGFKVHYSECPYSNEGYRFKIQDMLNEMENNYPGTKQGIIKSFLALLPKLKEEGESLEEPMQTCKECGEPANRDICNACKMKVIISA